MSSRFELRVFGIPKAQGRARAYAFKKGEHTHVRMYDPETSRDWKRTVAHEAAIACGGRPPVDRDVALDLELTFLLPRPKSLQRRYLFPTKKPDCDNLAKAVKDALKGIVYTDDSQVVSVTIKKRFPGILAPGVLIRVMETPPE